MILVKSNILANKSFEFALEIIKLYKYLVDDKHEYILPKQLLRSRTGIWANIRKGISAHSVNQIFDLK